MLIETTPAAPDAEAKAARPRNRWHAVIVVPHGHACDAALACRGKRFLSSEAPRLPLKDCNAAQCECRYRHFADRRGADRRKDDATAAATDRSDHNRRGRRGRRAGDV